MASSNLNSAVVKSGYNYYTSYSLPKSLYKIHPCGLDIVRRQLYVEVFDTKKQLQGMATVSGTSVRRSYINLQALQELAEWT